MGLGENDMSTKQNDETQSRWYMVNKDGMATLCADQADAEQEAKNAQEAWPHMGPHRAVQLRESSGAWFTAADMATAAAQGFREGQAAELAAMRAGGEPVAEMVPCYTPSGKRVAVISRFQHLPIGTKLYTHPQPAAQDAEDAARYRWMRGPVEESTRYSRWRIEYWDGPNGWQPMQRERMDSAIDAARKQGANHD